MDILLSEEKRRQAAALQIAVLPKASSSNANDIDGEAVKNNQRKELGKVLLEMG